MAKFGSFNSVKSQYPYEQVDADYMMHEGEYVKLFQSAKTVDDSDEMVAVFRLEKGCNVRKIE
jgi:hypothetical protein